MVKAVPVKPQKLIADRIPPEGSPQAVAEAAAEPNSGYTLQADAIPQPGESKPKAAEAKPVAEKIVAVEALPERDPQSGAADPDQDELTTQSSDAPLSGWSVQLSSAREEKLAWGTWEKLKARHKALGDMKPVVIKADLGKKGIYYRLRVRGFDSKAEARSACGKLKSNGLSCFVSKVDS
jgi:hypothetical protein